MNDFPRMLYRMPGRDVLTDSGWCATLIVQDATAQEAAAAEGWCQTSDGAAQALRAASVPVVPPDDAPPTRDELERKAAELGIKVDGRWSDKRLGDAIAEKLKG